MGSERYRNLPKIPQFVTAAQVSNPVTLIPKPVHCLFHKHEAGGGRIGRPDKWPQLTQAARALRSQRERVGARPALPPHVPSIRQP